MVPTAAYYQLGVLLQRSHRPQKAAKFYLEALNQDPADYKATYNLAMCIFEMGDLEAAVYYFQKALRLKHDLVDAHVNLSAVLVKLMKPEEALIHCERALVIDPEAPSVLIQMNTILRILGRKSCAISLSWKRLGEDKYTHAPEDHKYKQDNHICASSPSSFPSQHQKLTVIMLKWGKKYGAEYVNNLARGVKRHLHMEEGYEILCLTDDKDGIDNEVVRCLPLPKHSPLSGWWLKAYLFSPDSPIAPGTRCCYLDLDTVILGPLGGILRGFSQPLGLLSTDTMANEGRKGGYNSSIIIWTAGTFEEVYTKLIYRFEDVKGCIYKFDHWLEMILQGREGEVGLLQEAYPGLIQEYKSCMSLENGSSNNADNYDSRNSVDKLLAGVSVLCFPLRPKPHECLDVPVVQEHWKGMERYEGPGEKHTAM